MFCSRFDTNLCMKNLSSFRMEHVLFHISHEFVYVEFVIFSYRACFVPDWTPICLWKVCHLFVYNMFCSRFDTNLSIKNLSSFRIEYLLLQIWHQFVYVKFVIFSYRTCFVPDLTPIFLCEICHLFV